MSFCGLLDFIIFIDKSAVSPILASLKVKCLLASNLVLVFVFSILTMMCLSVFFFVFRNSSFLNVGLMCGFFFFLSVLKKNAAVICQILLSFTSLSLFTLRHSNVRYFIRSYVCLTLLSVSPTFLLSMFLSDIFH